MEAMALTAGAVVWDSLTYVREKQSLPNSTPSESNSSARGVASNGRRYNGISSSRESHEGMLQQRIPLHVSLFQRQTKVLVVKICCDRIPSISLPKMHLLNMSSR